MNAFELHDERRPCSGVGGQYEAEFLPSKSDVHDPQVATNGFCLEIEFFRHAVSCR